MSAGQSYRQTACKIFQFFWTFHDDLSTAFCNELKRGHLHCEWPGEAEYYIEQNTYVILPLVMKQLNNN